MKNIKIILLCLLFVFSSCMNKSERKFLEKYYDRGVDKDLITEDNIKSLVFDTYFFIGNNDYWFYFVDDNKAIYCLLKLDTIDKKLDKKTCLKIIDEYKVCNNMYSDLSMFEIEVKKDSVCFDFFANDGRTEENNRIIECFYMDN